MKLIPLFAAAAVLAVSAVQAADKHDSKPLHGGVVAEARHVEYELVAKPDVLQLYARDHGKALDLSKASAKVTLLTGSEKQETELKPAGERLEARGAFKVGAASKVVAVVTMPGKSPATVRFSMK